MTRHNPLKGILLVCLAVMTFASLDGVTKYLVSSHGVLMLLLVRYWSQSIVLAAWVIPRYGLGVLRVNCLGLQLLRGLSLLSVSLFFISALRVLPLAEATAVNFLAPLLVVLLAMPVLGERVSFSQCLPVLIGFVGVLIIVRPGGGLLTPAMLLPLASATCFALYQLLTRRIGTRDGAATTNLVTGLIGALGTSLIVPWFWEGQAFPPLPDLLALASLGLIAVIGHMLLTFAFQFSSPVLLAPFTYLQIFFAGLFGFFVFHHVPDFGALLGMAIIAASGIFSAWLQAKQRREALAD